MIKLTRLSGEQFILNADLIRYVESQPDTHIILTTNDRFMVRESADEVVRRAIDYARQVAHGLAGAAHHDQALDAGCLDGAKQRLRIDVDDGHETVAPQRPAKAISQMVANRPPSERS